MEGGNVEEKQQRGYGGALWGTNLDWCFRARGALEDQGAGAFREEGGDPVNHVGGDVLLEEKRPEFGGIDIVETGFNVEKKGGDSLPRALEGADFMDQGGAGIGGAEPRKGAALVSVEEAGFAGQSGESDGHDPLQYLGDGFEEDNYAERGRCVI